MSQLPHDSQERKARPIATGVLDYFPAALAAVAQLSKSGNDKHNPGEVMHHARGKSGDHADCILRHLIDRGTVDDDGFLHEVKVAWRALALLQEALEERGAPLARGARLDITSTQLCPNYAGDRIAGDAHNKDIKNRFYYSEHDDPNYAAHLDQAQAFAEAGVDIDAIIEEKDKRYQKFRIRGYCAWCDAEIGDTQPFFVGNLGESISGIKYCSAYCLDRGKDEFPCES